MAQFQRPHHRYLPVDHRFGRKGITMDQEVCPRKKLGPLQKYHIFDPL